MNMASRLMLLGLIMGGACVGFASAQDIKAGNLEISHPWSRATPAGAHVAAGYLVVMNKGTTADRLVGGSSSISGKVEIHEMAMKDNVMTMRPIPGGLPIEAGQSVTLGPGGYHIMFEDLKTPLKEGGKFAATLQFEKAGKVEVTFDVAGVGAQAPASGASDHNMSGHMDHKM